MTLLNHNVFAVNGVIKGKILPVDSNATIYAFYPTKEIAGFTTINSEGEYSIAVPLGIYDLLIVAKGDYINRTIFQIGVKEDEITEIQNITLAKVGETGSISGYINPIVEGVVVQIKKFGSSEFSASSVVDSNGKYEIIGLEPNTYGLFVKFDLTQNFYDYKWGMINIKANASLMGINLTFTPRSSKYLIDRIIVEFQPSISEGEKRAIINSLNSEIMEHYSYSQNYEVSVPPDKTAEQMVELFKENPNVEDARLYTFSRIVGFGQSEEETAIEEKLNDSSIELNETPPQTTFKVSKEREYKSLSSRLIQFLKSLFGFK